MLHLVHVLEDHEDSTTAYDDINTVRHAQRVHADCALPGFHCACRWSVPRGVQCTL